MRRLPLYLCKQAPLDFGDKTTPSRPRPTLFRRIIEQDTLFRTFSYLYGVTVIV